MKKIHNIKVIAAVLEKASAVEPYVILGSDFEKIVTAKEIKKIHHDLQIQRFYYIEKSENFSFGNESELNEQKARDTKLLVDSAYYRWLDISANAIPKSKNYREAHEAWEDTPPDPYLKELGLLKMLEFANEKQTMGIFASARHPSVAEKRSLEKLDTF
jgi:hypothetical protein